MPTLRLVDTELAAPRLGRRPIQVSDPFDCVRVSYRVPRDLLDGLTSGGDAVFLREADLIVEYQARHS